MSCTDSLRRWKRSCCARPFGAHDDLVERLAGAYSEDDPARRQAAERGKRLCHHRGVVAQGRGQHAGAQDDSLRRGCRRAQPGDGVGRMAIGMAPGLVVVAGPDGVEAVLFRGDGEVEELSWAELFSRGLVAESKHRVLSGASSVARTRPCALNHAVEARFMSRTDPGSPAEPARRGLGRRPTEPAPARATRATTRQARPLRPRPRSARPDRGRGRAA